MKIHLLLASLCVCSMVEANAQKLKPSGIDYNYELAAGIILPENIRTYHAAIQTDVLLIQPERMQMLRDSVSRIQSAKEKRQAAIQQAFVRENAKVAKAMYVQHLKLNSAAYFKKSGESDFSLQLQVKKVDTRFTSRSEHEGDTLLRVAYEAAAKVMNHQTEQVVYSRTAMHEPFSGYITKKNMILFFTPQEAIDLKLHKGNEELKQQIYANALERLDRKVFQHIVDSTSADLNNQLLPKRQFSFALYSAKGKYDYADMDRALEIMKEVSKARRLNPKTEMTLEEEAIRLKEAIAIWEKELLTEDITNKKARISAAVGEGLRYNCALAFMFMKDFESATAYINRVNTKSPTFIAGAEDMLPANALELKQWISESKKRTQSTL